MKLEEKKEQVWKEYERFKKDYALSLKSNKAFSELVTSIMDERGYTVEKLCELSGIDTRTIYRLRSGKIKNSKGEEREYLPHVKTIIAFSIACDLDMLMTITLLESLGLSFKRTSETHYAYCFLIVNCRGKSIDECNDMLRKLKIDEEYLLRHSS